MPPPTPLPLEPLDLIIIGAGIYGVCAASTYLTLHPEAHVLVLDADSGPGGVWSKSRLYPGFCAQTGVRLCGFPDVPFELPEGDETFHDLFPAERLTGYFGRYLGREVGGERSGKGVLRERFWFGVWVERVKREGEVWRVVGKAKAGDEGGNGGGEERVDLKAKKIIVATGVFTTPFVPELPGREHFSGPILHQKHFGRSKVLTADEPDIEKHNNITVLGGSKTAADIAYAAATDPNHSRKVTWIVRTSGTGPLLLTHPKGFGKYKSLPEVGTTRIVSSLSTANPYVDDSWWSWFLHRSPVGEWLLDKIWSQAAGSATELADFEGREGKLEGFEGLRSSTSVRWRSGQQGILQRDDWWDVIARKVRIVRGEIEKLEDGKIVMEDGSVVRSDVVLSATGWVHGHTVFSSEDKAALGLPLDLDKEAELAEEEKQHWQDLQEETDKKVLQRWPYLATAPAFKKQPINSTPYRLYNMIVPTTSSDFNHSIAFLGIPVLPNSYHTALATTLWAIAVLDGAHKLPSQEEMEKDVAFISSWCAKRYPVDGWLGNRVEFEMVSFTDKLLKELGLDSHRKEGWWADLTDPCLAVDDKGIVGEYREKYMTGVERGNGDEDKNSDEEDVN